MYNTSKQTLHESYSLSLNVKIKMAKKRKVRLEKKKEIAVFVVFLEKKNHFSY